MVLSILCDPQVVVLRNAPDDMMDGVLGPLLRDLDQGITELLDTLWCNVAAPCGVTHNVQRCSFGFRSDECGVGLSQWYQFIHPPANTCMLSPQEAGHCRAQRAS